MPETCRRKKKLNKNLELVENFVIFPHIGFRK